MSTALSVRPTLYAGRVAVVLDCEHPLFTNSTSVASGDSVACAVCAGACRDCRRRPAVRLGRCTSCDADYVQMHREEWRQDQVNRARRSA